MRCLLLRARIGLYAQSRLGINESVSQFFLDLYMLVYDSRVKQEPLPPREAPSGLDSEDVCQDGGCRASNALHHPDFCVPNLVFARASRQLQNNLARLV